MTHNFALLAFINLEVIVISLVAVGSLCFVPVGLMIWLVLNQARKKKGG